MKSWLAAAVAGLALLTVACSPHKKAETAPTAAATKIRFVTDWRAEAEHGGIYEALATGEYAKRGLDVTIVQGGPGVNVPQLLAAGSAEMGVGSNSFLVLQMAKEGVPLKAVAAMMQKDPQVLMAHPGEVASIADMKGRPIFLSAAARDSFWPWLKAKYGFTDDQFRSYANSAPFVQEKRSVQQGYVFSEPYTIEKATGLKPQLFLLADNGYPSYAGMILAPDKFAAAHPDAVQAFVAATAAGWNTYLNGDPKPADVLIMKDNPEQSPDVLAQARDKMRQYGIVQPTGMTTAQIGTMTDARWADTFKVASDLGLVPKDLDVHKAYTLQYLPAAK
ncbi:MAG TPA: ABC transporter substrate-binding protein [Caulobacteraceae bacterium]|nr:ABC transporter substrate-binding protein [Caulobacteraceae bacterium]